MEDKIGLTASIKRALGVMHSTIHTGLKVSPFELYHGGEPRTEITKIIKDNESYLSNWTTLNVSVPLKPIPIYLTRNEIRELTDHMILARKKKTPYCASPKSPKRRPVKTVSETFQ